MEKKYKFELEDKIQTLKYIIFITINGVLDDEKNDIMHYIRNSIHDIDISANTNIIDMICMFLPIDFIMELCDNDEIASKVVAFRYDIGDEDVIRICQKCSKIKRIEEYIATRSFLSQILQDYLMSFGDNHIILNMLKGEYQIYDNIVIEILAKYYDDTAILTALCDRYGDNKCRYLMGLLPKIGCMSVDEVVLNKILMMNPDTIIYSFVKTSSNAFDIYICPELKTKLDNIIYGVYDKNFHLDEEYIMKLLKSGDIYSVIRAIACNVQSSFYEIKMLICRDFGSSYSKDVIKKAGISDDGFFIIKKCIRLLYLHVYNQYCDDISIALNFKGIL